MSKIFMLHGDIQTGKSEALMQWIVGKNVCGFITPTLLGSKHFYDIESKTYHAYELDVANEDSIGVGKYHLDAKAFERGRQLFEVSKMNQTKWFVIDEIGKLELAGKGHADLLQQVLNSLHEKVLLVVRTELVDAVIAHFDLKEVSLLDKKNLSVLE